MNKKILALSLAFAMITPGMTFADDIAIGAKSEISINVNGARLEMDQPPIIENGRTLVPLRAVAEALGCNVEWDNTAKTASFVQGDVTAVITVGENYILAGDGVYNEEFPIDTPAVIKNSRTMIPLRALSECFGYDVKWDSETMTVDISSKSMERGDTDNAGEQEYIGADDNNMLGKVKAYSGILKGTAGIIDAVNYESEEYTVLKEELDKILADADTMSYDELMEAFTKLKEIDGELVDTADSVGVGDIVADYYNEVEASLAEIIEA
ncbi:MAG: copper amine oxidase N-terminal domain-containing protein [Clostridia bacterium]|nr:copper amine oxidase N-terminal domain-containing protein [Clostridia bacterium]